MLYQRKNGKLSSNLLFVGLRLGDREGDTETFGVGGGEGDIDGK